MRLCIAVQSPVQPSETFIRAHLERLPHEVVCLHGYELNYTWNGRTLREWHSARPRAFCDKALNLLPRFAEWRLRRRFFPSPSDLNLTTAFLREQKIEVVLAEYGTTGAFITPACEAAAVPLVVHFHGFDAAQRTILEKFGNSYSKMFAYASGVVVVSQAMRQKLAALGCPAEKLTVTHCGPHPSFFDIKPDYSSNKILAVGRLCEKKAPHLALLAFKLAAEECPELNFCLLGNGELLGVCEDLIAALELREKVRLMGMASPEIVREQMAGSFLFAQHSVVAANGDSEGTPVAVLEAGAAGLPIASTRHAGICDVVIPGKTGLLVAERDVAGMAKAIITLAQDRSRAQTMGEAARIHVASHFTMERHLADINSVLLKAVSCAR